MQPSAKRQPGDLPQMVNVVALDQKDKIFNVVLGFPQNDVFKKTASLVSSGGGPHRGASFVERAAVANCVEKPQGNVADALMPCA